MALPARAGSASVGLRGWAGWVSDIGLHNLIPTTTPLRLNEEKIITDDTRGAFCYAPIGQLYRLVFIQCLGT